MIAVTVATPGYEQLAQEQAEFARRFTNLNVHIVYAREPGFHHKLELHRVYRGHRILYFDADLRLIRRADWSQIAKDGDGAFIAAPDPGIHDTNQFPSPDSMLLGIDRLQYFNSGLFIADFRNPRIVRAFELARQLMAERENGMWGDIADQGDQSFMNAGVQRCGVPVKLLHPRYNFFFHAWRWGCLPEIPRNIIGLHAAGTHMSEKKAILDAQHQIFGLSMGDGSLPNVAKWYKKL